MNRPLVEAMQCGILALLEVSEERFELLLEAVKVVEKLKHCMDA